MSDKTTTKVCFVVALERWRMANPIPNVSALLWAINASARQSPKTSGVLSPTTAAAQSSVGA
jgi:hypothetical protein